METLLSISLIVALTLWAGLALASFIGKLVARILPLMKVSTPAGAEGPGESVSEEKGLAMVA